MRKQRTENREQGGNTRQGLFCFLFSVHCSRRASRGFTLIELITVCAIMALIAGLIMANQGKFGGQVLLQNFAYDVALSLRQAQVYGISVQRFQRTGQYYFDAGHGININLSTSNTRYVLYADSYPAPPSPPNGLYDSALNQDEVKQTMNITRGYTISGLCVVMSGTTCAPASVIDVVFVRPEPDALISWRSSSGTLHRCLPQRIDCAQEARITMHSPRGDTMDVRVSNNGQISVDQRIENANN